MQKDDDDMQMIEQQQPTQDAYDLILDCYRLRYV